MFISLGLVHACADPFFAVFLNNGLIIKMKLPHTHKLGRHSSLLLQEV